MTNELVKKDEQEIEFSVIERVVMQGDLSKLDAQQRVLYYRKVCESAGLNPFTRPFDYISLNGKLTLYAKKDATEQLRKLNGISIVKLESQVMDDLYIVKATARTKDGRTDEATGAVTIGNLRGDAKANAIMKAETKAKRRVTLSISGMGWTDESEIESIPNAKAVDVDLHTGELKNSFIDHIAKVETINNDQVEELTNVLKECDQEYKTEVWKSWKKLWKINTMADIPASEYDGLISGAMRRISDNIKKKESEKQPTTDEIKAAMDGE